MGVVEFSPEFMLALDCCSAHFRDGSRPEAKILDVDWSRFVDLVRFHRIQGLAWDLLSSSGGHMPTQAAQALRSDAADIAAANLRAAVECRRLLNAFEAAGQPILFLKGLTLGGLAYGNASLKSGVDVDLLVDPAQLAPAAAILAELGYVGARDSASLAAWHQARKDSQWSKPGTGMAVDLHTRLTDNPRLLPGITVHSQRQMVDVGGGIGLPALALDELFAHLAVHGASSAWFRLKWISDFAALVSPLSASEIDRLYRRSQELGAGRAAGQALLVADRLFKALDELPELRAELSADRRTLLLTSAALKQLAGTREPTSHAGGTWRIHWTQFLLLPGLGFKLAELTRQARAALSSRG
ncbi:MAG: nucleotidyltransferase family protein [Pseudomonadota bacterium]